MNYVSIVSKMMYFTELYSVIKIIDIYQEQKWSKNSTLWTPYLTEALLRQGYTVKIFFMSIL